MPILIIILMIILIKRKKIKIELATVIATILISIQIICSLYVLIDPLIIYRKGDTKIETYDIGKDGIKHVTNSYGSEYITEIVTDKKTFQIGHFDKVGVTLKNVNKEEVEIYITDYKIKNPIYRILLLGKQPKERQLRNFNIHYPQLLVAYKQYNVS